MFVGNRAVAQNVTPVSNGPAAMNPAPSGQILPAFARPAAPVEIQLQENAQPDQKDVQPKQKEALPHNTFPHADILPAQYTRKSEADQEFYMPEALPGPGRLYGPRESEAQWKERMRQEAKNLGERKVFFPEPTVDSRQVYRPRRYDPSVCLVTNGYIVHERLLFEQVNLERYGWDLGVLTPVANVAAFYYDMVMLPYHCWSRPLDQMDSSAGKYLPGDNVPLLLYPESFSLTGLAGMAGTYLAGPFIFR